ncbi:Heat shock 70 kDa protein [Orchesella cincta]|uniref:Heat shock 70 kDa protein n=1 Tax=Orchesella cincta TaxID=48709 RepID=A0A1D2MAQ4_ORCCI|nr:Heat shock 70 kDa protein [Orchesella cincta]
MSVGKMEDWQKTYITNSRDKLIELTRCDTNVAAKLLSRGILSESDSTRLECIRNENDKTHELYKIVMTKINGYEILIEVLEESKQSGAANILRKGVPPKCDSFPRRNKSKLVKQDSKQKTLDVQNFVEQTIEDCITDYRDKLESILSSQPNLVSDPVLKEKHSKLCEDAMNGLEQKLAQFNGLHMTTLKARLLGDISKAYTELKQKFMTFNLSKNNCLLEYNTEMNAFLVHCTSEEFLQEFHVGCLEQRVNAFLETLRVQDISLTGNSGFCTEEIKRLLENAYQKHKTALAKKLSEDDKLDNHTISSVLDKYHEEMKVQFGNQLHLRDNQVQETHNNACILAISRCANKRPESQKQELRQMLDKYLRIYQQKNEMSGSQSDPAIGIDLGTVNCCVAVYWNGKVQIVTNQSGNKSTPSYVAYDGEGNVEAVGHAAKRNAFENPETTIYDSKRVIGRSIDDKVVVKDRKTWPFTLVDDDNEEGCPKYQVHDKLLRPEDVSAELLIECRSQAEAFLNCRVKKAVITVPAYFNDDQKRATLNAGKIADLEVLTIINEPTAAGIAYGWDILCDRPKMVLIFDLGGGTFDVAIINIDSHNINVIAFDGDTHLGGDDVDIKLMQHCADEFKASTNIDLFARAECPIASAEERLSAKRSLQRLHDACETCKKELSFYPTQTVIVDAIANGKNLRIKVTRQTLDDNCSDLYKRMLTIVDRLMKKAQNSKYPTQGEELFYTSRDDQDSGQIRVYQGDGKMANENYFIGSYIYKGIPRGKKGTQSIRVIMKINSMGTLDVEVVCESTKKSECVQLGAVPFVGNSRKVLEVRKTKSREPQIPE